MNVIKKILIGVFLFVILVFALFPFYIMVKNSFQPYKQIVSYDFNFFPKSWTYFKNYKEVLINYSLARWIFNSIVVVSIVILTNVIFDTIAAFSMSRLDFYGRDIGFKIVLITLIVPMQVIVVPLYLMMVKLGWLNSYIGLLAPYAMSPFGIFYLRQSFLQIPKELDEAALIDGANYLQILTRIIIPNSFSALGTLIVLKFMWTWGSFLWPSLVANDETMYTLPVGIATFQRAGGTVPWDLVMPASVIAVIPVIILFIFLQRYFIRGLTSGALKG